MAQYLQSEVTFLQNEVDVADGILLNPTSQEIVDNENSILSNYNTKFELIGMDFTDLDAKINQSKTMYNTYDAAKTTTYVHVPTSTASSFRTLILSTITNRNTYLQLCKMENSSFNRDTVISSISNLLSTLTTSYNEFSALMNTVPVDKTDLNTLIDQVTVKLSSVTKGTAVNQCPDPYHTNLSTGLTSAIAVKNNASATQSNVDTTYNQLVDLLNIFDDKTIDKLFVGYYNEISNTYYGTEPRTMPNEDEVWIPAEVIDGVYISPVNPPTALNSTGTTYVESIKGYVLTNNIISPDQDKYETLSLSKTVAYGNIYINSDFSVPVIYAMGTESEATEIYEKYATYFEHLGVSIPTITDALFFKAERRWIVSTVENQESIPQDDYYLVITPSDGNSFIQGTAVQEYFNCYAIA